MKSIALIFDMDGVIVDSNPAHKKALEIFLKKYGFDMSEDEMKANIYGTSNIDWIPRLFGEISQEDFLKYEDEKEGLFREIYAKDIAPVKGLPSFLDMAQKNNIQMAIGTSAPPENVEFVLSHTGLGIYFPIIKSQKDITKGKPDPEIYLKAIETLQLPSNQCIVIEDSMSGIQAGKAANCKVIGVTTTHTKKEFSHCDYVINDFDELALEHISALVG